MAKLEQRRYKDVHKYFCLTEKSVDYQCSQQIFFANKAFMWYNHINK